VFQQQAARQQATQDGENVIEGEVIRESGNRTSLPHGEVIYQQSSNDKSY